MLGPYAWAYWIMVSCNVVTPQFLWFRKIRRNVALVFILSILINVGMWFERFVIITISLTRDYLPASWDNYAPTLVELATLIGSFGLFFTLFLILARFLPMIAIGEVKGVLSYGRKGIHVAGEEAGGTKSIKTPVQLGSGVQGGTP